MLTTGALISAVSRSDHPASGYFWKAILEWLICPSCRLDLWGWHLLISLSESSLILMLQSFCPPSTNYCELKILQRWRIFKGLCNWLSLLVSWCHISGSILVAVLTHILLQLIFQVMVDCRPAFMLTFLIFLPFPTSVPRLMAAVILLNAVQPLFDSMLGISHLPLCLMQGFISHIDVSIHPCVSADNPSGPSLPPPRAIWKIQRNLRPEKQRCICVAQAL